MNLLLKRREMLGKAPNYLYFEAREANSTIALTNYGNNAPIIYWSYDRSTWTYWDYSAITLTNVGDKVYMYGENPNRISESDSKYSTFAISGDVLLGGDLAFLMRRGGNIVNALNYAFYRLFYSNTDFDFAEDFEISVTITSHNGGSYLFYDTFAYCTGITVCPDIFHHGQVYAGQYSMHGMFRGCTNLTKAPALPFTDYSFSCCTQMFLDCTSLLATPVINHRTGECRTTFNGMFKNCTSLTSANFYTIGSSGTYADHCKEMFKNCTSLVDASHITIAGFNNTSTGYGSDCQEMFAGCTVLTTLPNIANPNVFRQNTFRGMFYGCTSLTKALPLTISGSAKSICQEMYYGCTSLTDISDVTLSATTLSMSCYDSMFSRCSSLTTAPALPATSLEQYCYQSMFSYCSSLTAAPELPATTLVGNCYKEMFYFCSNLSYIKAMFTTTPGTSYCNNWVNGVSKSGTFVKNPNATWNVWGVHGVPNTWVTSDYTLLYELYDHTCTGNANGFIDTGIKPFSSDYSSFIIEMNFDQPTYTGANQQTFMECKAANESGTRGLTLRTSNSVLSFNCAPLVNNTTVGTPNPGFFYFRYTGSTNYLTVGTYANNFNGSLAAFNWPVAIGGRYTGSGTTVDRYSKYHIISLKIFAKSAT